ncbi:MAG: DNA cytosine methyltransferase [Desulfitobacteriaceae bacterium]
MYKTVDLFAGIGGIRRGFEMTGYFKNVLSAEIDTYACKTYEHLFGENPKNDVTSEDFKKKVEGVKYDVLLAGFPCQAFSRAGKQEGFMDRTRGTLFFDVADIINRTRPKAFLLENVDNLISHEKGETFKIIIEALVKELGYKVIGVEIDGQGNVSYDARRFVLNSRNFGIPQNRPRVYMMGFDKQRFNGEIYKLPIKELPKKRESKPLYKDLSELLNFGESLEYYIAEGYLNTLKKHRSRHEQKGNGFGYMVVNAPEIQNPFANAILATGGSGKERNLVYDPQEGIGGRVYHGKKTPLNAEGIRHMTPSEWGKLQGFVGYAFLKPNGKDGFSFPKEISKAQQYKQLGNSVTIPVLEVLAEKMYECLSALESEVGIEDVETAKSNSFILEERYA